MKNAHELATSWIRVRIIESLIATLAALGYAGRYTVADWTWIAAAGVVHVATSVGVLRALRSAERGPSWLRKWEVVTALLATMLLLLAAVVAGPMAAQLHALSQA